MDEELTGQNSVSMVVPGSSIILSLINSASLALVLVSTTEILSKSNF